MKVLAADYLFCEGAAELIAHLQAHGVEVVINPYGRRLSPDELVALGRDCDGTVAGSERYTAEILDQLPRLRCISRIGVGVDNIDLDGARQRGVEVRTTPDGPTEAVAEFTVALMLSLLRGIPQMERAVREGMWNRTLGRQLEDLTVGLVGLGRIGRKVAEILRALGADVCGYDVVPMDSWAAVNQVRLVDFDDLLAGVDILSLHLSHSPSTHHLINDQTLGKMRSASYLVNTSRGGLVDEAALYRALVNGHLAGAALDVFAQEPYRGPLATLPQVILTPHAASHTREARAHMQRQAVENLIKVLGPPQGWRVES